MSSTGGGRAAPNHHESELQIFSLSLFSLSYELFLRPDEKQMEVRKEVSFPPFYVWDHVAVALHVDSRVPLFIYLFISVWFSVFHLKVMILFKSIFDDKNTIHCHMFCVV